MTTEPKVKAKPRNTTRLTPSGEETIMDLLIKFTLDEAGAPAVEYAILLACIATAIAASVSTFGIAIRGLFESVVAQGLSS
jgi:Flp pilus assembly pilin Flp